MTDLSTALKVYLILEDQANQHPIDSANRKIANTFLDIAWNRLTPKEIEYLNGQQLIET